MTYLTSKFARRCSECGLYIAPGTAFYIEHHGIKTRVQCAGCHNKPDPNNFGIVVDPQEVCDSLGINYDPRQWVKP